MINNPDAKGFLKEFFKDEATPTNLLQNTWLN